MKLQFFGDYNSRQQLATNLTALKMLLSDDNATCKTVISYFHEAVYGSTFPHEAVMIFSAALEKMQLQPNNARLIGLDALKGFQDQQSQREKLEKIVAGPGRAMLQSI